MHSYIFCTVIADDGAEIPSWNHDDVNSGSGDDLGSDSDSEMINNIPDWIKYNKIHDFRAGFDKLKVVEQDTVSDFALKIIKKFQRAERIATRRAGLNKADGARGRSSRMYENEMPSAEEEEKTAERGRGKEEGDEEKLKDWLDVPFLWMKDQKWGRGILSRQIANLGKYRTSNKDKDKKEYEPTLRLIREVLKSSTHLLRTTGLNKKQSLFHEAAENGLCDVIDLCNELILKEAGDDKLGRAWVSRLIAGEDSEHHSALYLAVQEDVEDYGYCRGIRVSRKASCGRQRAEDKENSGNAFLLMERGQLPPCRWVGSTPIYICHQGHVVPPHYTTVNRLMLLLEPGAIAIQGEDLRVTLTKAIQFGSLKLLCTLLDGEDRAGTASGAPAENGNLPVQKGKFDWIPPEMLEFAIKKNKINIAKFLVAIRPSILEDNKCDFLRCAVEADLEGMVEFLLLKRPKLALNRSTPILTSLVGSTINSKKIKSHILPVLMRGTPRISLLRKHLGGGSCM